MTEADARLQRKLNLHFLDSRLIANESSIKAGHVKLKDSVLGDKKIYRLETKLQLFSKQNEDHKKPELLLLYQYDAATQFVK